MRLPIVISFLLLIFYARLGVANVSNFRLIKSTPTSMGVKLTFVYDNAWATPQRTEQEKDVRLYAVRKNINNANNANNVPTYQPPVDSGIVEMKGVGMVDVDLDYSKLGLFPGEAVTFSGKWTNSGHAWGETYGQGRAAGGELVLPQFGNGGEAAKQAPKPRFRITQKEQTDQGMKVRLQFDNNWGSDAENQNNREVELYLHCNRSQSYPPNEQNGQLLCKVDAVGSSTVDLDIDYAKVGFGNGFTGDYGYLRGKWVRSGYSWWDGYLANFYMYPVNKKSQ